MPHGYRDLAVFGRWGLAALVAAFLFLPASSASAEPPPGTISPIVGNPTAPGPASTIGQEPVGIASAPDGSLFIVDSYRMSVREVDAAGQETTFAGNGTPGFSGDSGPAGEAALSEPGDVALDGAGDVLISDTGNQRVRLVATANCTSDCPYGLATTKGDIYTIAGTGTQGFSGDGGTATAAELGRPGGLAVDGAGDVLISDAGNQRVRLVAATNCTSNCPYGLAATAQGDIYTIAGTGTQGFSGDDGTATAAKLDDPGDLAVDSSGDLLISDTENQRVRLVAAADCTSNCPYGLAATRRATSTRSPAPAVPYSGGMVARRPRPNSPGPAVSRWTAAATC